MKQSVESDLITFVCCPAPPLGQKSERLQSY